MRSLRLAVLLLVASSSVVAVCAIACNGANCSKSSDCNTDGGETCLFPAGGGCSSQGHCEKQDTCKEGAGPPTVFCSCSGQTLALECVPSNGITDRATPGVCPMAMDGGTEE